MDIREARAALLCNALADDGRLDQRGIVCGEPTPTETARIQSTMQQLASEGLIEGTDQSGWRLTPPGFMAARAERTTFNAMPIDATVAIEF